MSEATDSPLSDASQDAAAGPTGEDRVLRSATDLARLREARGFSAEDAGRHLRIGSRQIAALEAGEWAALPGNAFMRGAIRAYARWLDADATPLLASLGDAGGSPELRAPASLQTPMPRPGMLGFEAGGSGSRWAWIALVLAGVAVIALYFAGQGERGGAGPTPAPPAAAPPSTEPANAGSSSAPAAPGTVIDAVPIGGGAPSGSASSPGAGSAAAPVATPSSPAAAPQQPVAPAPVPASPPVVAPPLAPAVPGTVPPTPSRAPSQGAAPSDSPGTPGELRLTLREESWIEVRGADGAVLLTGSQPAGAARTISGTRPLRVVVGNAGGVALEFDGRPVDVAGQARANVARLELR